MVIRRMWLIPFLLLFFTGICVGEEEVISKITLLGNVKIEEGVIRGAIKSRERGPFSAEQVREDLRSIFGLGYFTDVQVDIKSTPEGKEVIFILVEKPSIKEVAIKGNQKVKLEDIRDKMTLSVRSILNLEKVKENVELIRRLYFSKGYYGVSVQYKVDSLETNEVAVTYDITEGPKGHIKAVIFKGNKKIKSSQLRKAMTTKKRNILSFITKTGVLDEDVLKNDIQLLTAYYFDHGYLEAKISEPKIDLSDPKRIRIEINITEGPLYRIGEIDFKGDVLTTKEALFKGLKIKRSDVYSNSAVRREIGALTEKFANQGYANVDISPETAIDSKNLLVNIVFEIEKKKRVSFEKIQVVGNTKSRDKVIRRELRVEEGELYNSTALNQSRDRLKRLGFFKEVDLSTSRGSTDEKVNLDVKVEEAPTGALSFGIGYSSLDQVLGTASISERNLFGLGYNTGLRFQLGQISNNLRFGFTDPYFLETRFSAGTDLYHETREFDTYSYRITGGDLRTGRDLSDTLRGELMYKLESVNVFDVTSNASFFVQRQRGESTTSALSLGLFKDTRNDYFAPSRGTRTGIFLQNAGGPLGASNDFVKAVVDTSWFFPMPLGTVLNLRGKVGWIKAYGGKQLPIYEEFFVGGLGTVRGFEYGHAGPVDKNNEPIGATKMVAFNSELVFPLAREIGLRGAVFLDIGKGADHWDNIFPLRIGVGVGIRWFSPFGPINIDIGFNPFSKQGEKSRVIEFQAGAVY
jgi:outer membrane protein insertion porin family